MKRTVLIFGLIAGLIVAGMLAYGMVKCYSTRQFEPSMVLGYASMIVAFSFVFVGIKNYRDKYSHGIITFGKAFQVGMWISLIASSMYVVSWLLIFYLYVPDFMDLYSNYVITQARAGGASEAEITKQVTDMATYKDMYKSPVGVILLTYMEILPVGLLFTLAGAGILKKKPKPETAE